MTDLHPQAGTGSQLYENARFEAGHFIPDGDFIYPRRVKSITSFVADRPRIRNENQDPTRQLLPGVNAEATFGGIKIDYAPDVDSIVPFRVCHNGKYEVGAQLGTTAGAGTVQTNGTTAIVGTLSAFTATLVGQYISILGEPKPLKVATYTDATHITTVTAAATTASGKTWKYAQTPVFPWTMHPRTPIEALPSTYVDSMDHEIDDGTGAVVIYEMQQSELDIKTSEGKITQVSETWMGCYDTYASEASEVDLVSSYSARPHLFGHFSDTIAAALPFRVKISAAAGSGHDGKFKVAASRTLTGTLATDGTDTAQGTGSAFLSELSIGDAVYIVGEPTPLVVESITDNDTVVFTGAASTTAAGLTASAATFNIAETSFRFGVAARAAEEPNTFGISRSDDVWLTFPPNHGTVSVGDEWLFTQPRVLPSSPAYSTRDVLTGAGVEVTIDDTFVFGGTPGFAGFHNIDFKLTVGKQLNKSTGSKYAQGINPTGRNMATISFDRDRTDSFFLHKLINATSIKIVVVMYGNPFAGTGYSERWQFTFATCEVTKLNRDVATENTLPEKIDVTATRGPNGENVWTEVIYSTRGTLAA